MLSSIYQLDGSANFKCFKSKPVSQERGHRHEYSIQNENKKQDGRVGALCSTGLLFSRSSPAPAKCILCKQMLQNESVSQENEGQHSIFEISFLHLLLFPKVAQFSHIRHGMQVTYRAPFFYICEVSTRISLKSKKSAYVRQSQKI